MPLTGTYEPSMSEWARTQAEAYRDSDGQEANNLKGHPIIVITSIGAKSGNLRLNPLMRVEHNGSYAVIASKGGAENNPSWYNNIVKNPHLELQDGAVKRDYWAHLAEGGERDAWWAHAVAAWPDYAKYQERTEREIPVFVLTPLPQDD